MNETEVLAQVKKAIDLFMDKTYEEKEFYSHILAIIRDNSTTGENHSYQLKRLIYKADELRESQRKYYAGHKAELSNSKKLETEFDKKLFNLQTMGYTIDEFKKSKPVQSTLL